MTEQVTFNLRRGLSTGLTGWTAVNPVLSSGEPGFELDTTTLKIGNGSTNWNNLGNLRFGQKVAIGREAGLTGQGQSSIAIGTRAGETSQQGGGISIGSQAGQNTQQANSIAIGEFAGYDTQERNSIAIGKFAGQFTQQANSIAIGTEAGTSNQGTQSIAIGELSGNIGQGSQSIAIGRKAGETNQAANSIILNATGNVFNGETGITGCFYVNPVRKIIGSTFGFTNLYYNPITSEIVFFSN
jgi:hypothetical protein